MVRMGGDAHGTSMGLNAHVLVLNSRNRQPPVTRWLQPELNQNYDRRKGTAVIGRRGQQQG